MNEMKFKVADGEKIYAGNMVVINPSTLEVSEATPTCGMKVVGIATSNSDNVCEFIATSYVPEDFSLMTHEEIVNYFNDEYSKGDSCEITAYSMDIVGEITNANIGDIAYVEGPGSVSLSKTGTVAGRVFRVIGDYVYIVFEVI